MKMIKEIMSSDVEVITPNDTLQTAARKMRDHNIGFLPVCDGEKLVGVISDRDVIVRGLADGMESRALVGYDLISTPPIYCFDDQDVEEAMQIMQQNQIRRLVILTRDEKQMVGVLSLGDVALYSEDDDSGNILQSVSEPASNSRPEPG